MTRGLWDYAQAEHIAEEYDEFFAFNRLFDFDEAVAARYFTKPGLVADLGCGTGRALVPLVRSGHRGLAVDMSRPMLEVVAEKAREENLPIACLQASLVQLDAIGDATLDYAICLFSTLGMIHGRENRQAVLCHAQRILKPGGLLVLHVHNLWHNLLTSAGRVWLAGNLLKSMVRRDTEPGDKFFDYRGIPNMFLHTFRQGEIVGAIRKAGFSLAEMIPLDAARDAALPRPWLFGRLRANGWIFVCKK
jgi:ubiquinone/menaquinone biosynthesis C-methylase UbiE